MARRQPTRRASLIGGAVAAELNELKPGLGTALVSEINQRLTAINTRTTSQAGDRGTVAIAKQPGAQGIGLHLNDQRLSGLALPRDGNDAINLDYLRRFLSCEFFEQMFDDCVDLPPQAVLQPGQSEWSFAVAAIREIYTFQNSSFVLASGFQNFGSGQPFYNLVIFETPDLITNAPIVLHGTNSETAGKAITNRMLPDEANGLVHGGSSEGRLGGFGRIRIATTFNTYDISNVDALPLIRNVTVVYVDGPPGANGVTIGSISGAAAFKDGQAVVFQSGNGSIFSGDPTHFIYYYTIDTGSGGATVRIFDAFVPESPPRGTVGGVSIGNGNVAYVIYNRGGDPGVASYYQLICLGDGGAGPLLSTQAIDTGVPNADALATTLWIQASGTRLHILHAKFSNPPPSNAVDFHWKVYDITTPGHPILASDKVSPCNQWIGMSVEGDCVMLTEVGGFAPNFNNATLWDVSDAFNPRLIGGCRQRQTPGFQQHLNTFLRDSRGYYVTASRFVIQDFRGHGVTCA